MSTNDEDDPARLFSDGLDLYGAGLLSRGSADSLETAADLALEKVGCHEGLASPERCERPPFCHDEKGCLAKRSDVPFVFVASVSPVSVEVIDVGGDLQGRLSVGDDEAGDVTVFVKDVSMLAAADAGVEPLGDAS